MPEERRRRRRAPLWMRSARRRPATAVTLVVLSALAVALSTLTPILLRSAQSAALEEAVERAPVTDRSVSATAQAAGSADIAAAAAAVGEVAFALNDRSRWTAPVQAVGSSQSVPWRPTDQPRARLGGLVTVSLVPGCGAIRITDGSCPAKASQTAVPASVAARSHIAVGSAITLFPDDFVRRRRIAVVGVYDDAHGIGRAIAVPDALVGPPVVQPSGALLLGRTGLKALGLGYVVYQTQELRSPVRLTDVPGVLHGVAATRAEALTDTSGTFAIVVRTGLNDLLARVRGQLDAAAVLTAAALLEAVALAWFALGTAIQRISRVRAVEWGIGRTRGSRRVVWLATVFAEPGIAILIGALCGFPLGALIARAVATATVGAGVPTEALQPLPVAAAVVTTAGCLVALVAASVRSARLPLPALLRQTTEPRRISRFALVAQTGVLLVTAVVVWSVLTQRRIEGLQVALLLPSLLAVVVGVVALRVTVLAVRRGTARPPRSLTGLVVGRGLARSPSQITTAVMVAVGLSLATSVLALRTTAVQLQDERAEAQTGAATVLHVGVPAGRSLVDAVRRADPRGRTAMAVREVAGSGASGTGRIVAVDAPRLAAVTTWRSAWRGPSPASLARRLDPPAGAPLVLTGTRLTLTIAQLHQPPLSDPDLDRNVQLSAVVAAADGWHDVEFGLVRDGALSAPVPCSASCRLISLSLSDPNANTTGPFSLQLVIRAIATDRQAATASAAWLDGRRLWRQRLADETDETLPAQASGQGGAGGLALRFDAQNGGISPTIEPAVGAPVLPALLAAGTDAQPFTAVDDGVFGSDLAGAPLLLHVVGRAPVLPRALDDGVLVDLTQLVRVSDVHGARTIDEVWLAPGNHPAVLAALRREGIRIQGIETLAGQRTTNEAAAPVTALGLLLVPAAAALLLTLLALVGSRLVTWPSRARERAVLADAGVRSSALARMSAVEFALPNAVGAVLGVLAGLAADAISASRLPLTAGDPVGPPPDLAPAPGPILLLAAAAVVVILLAAAALAAVESRRALR